MQHSTVRSIIIWLWKDQLASGLIEVTIPNTNNQVNNTLYILSLRGWFPYIPTSFLSLYFIFKFIKFISTGLITFYYLFYIYICFLIRNKYLIFRLIRFHSPLLSESRLISFPFLNKMFYFRKFIFVRFSLELQHLIKPIFFI